MSKLQSRGVASLKVDADTKIIHSLTLDCLSTCVYTQAICLFRAFPLTIVHNNHSFEHIDTPNIWII
ncbi:hypothetical protein FGO68_gene1204 [Halteria grandinella]|uniref:Uncharacterized protein n=1 Tax=Halteria grandinella TaxID=5974 RepID=A0A8J8STW9_HALGN|nr:hypothetical protein FGO68_gene1204 [Halteria grandinella]